MRKLLLIVLSGTILGLLVVAQSALANPAHQSPPPPPPPPPSLDTPPPILPPPPPCPPGCPTDTPTLVPTATAVPTSTSTPIPTSTAVPLTLKVRLAHKTLNPKQKQTVRITTLAGSNVAITVAYPNGDKKKHSAVIGRSGKLNWSYTQPGSRITSSSRTASVTVTATAGTFRKHSTKRYTIGFAGIDVSIEPRTQRRGSAVGVWVHTNPGSLVLVTLHYTGGASQPLNGRTGGNGWLYLRYVVPQTAHVGKVSVVAQGSHSGKVVRGQTSFQVK